MGKSYDVIVVGLGAMGSAASYHLARRGIKVLGLEQFSIPHNWGSSHGHSRMIRHLYYEAPDYVPLLDHAYNLWHRLETESARRLIHITGGLYIGSEQVQGSERGNVLTGAKQSAEQYGLAYSLLTHQEARREFPQFRIPENHHILFDPDAGFVLPEAAIAAHAELALRLGADLRGHEPLLEWTSDSAGVRVKTAHDDYTASHLLFCGGAWSSRLLQGLGVELKIIRQVLVWVWPKRPDLFELGKLPVWFFEKPDGSHFYGFPMTPSAPGMKLAGHNYPAPASDPEVLRQGATAADAAPARHFLSRYMPDADGPILSLQPCMYVNSPDKHFILDRHPTHPNVTLACGFSGHGFKFAPLIGQILSELVCDGRSTLPIDFLRLTRPSLRSPAPKP